MYGKIIDTTIKKSMFEPFKLGDLYLKNRLVMSPMTRLRADPKTLAPTELMAQYYKQRTGFGLQITEATAISKSGLQVTGAPGIYTQEQADAWKKVIDAVHDGKGLIFIQLWHAGRVANPELTQQQPLGPSPIAIRGENKMAGGKPYPIPKEMTIQDMKQLLEDYKKAAELSKKAGFDGVQVSCGNGYFIDQFLKDGINKRTDEFGGSIENRSKFPLQVIDEVLKVYNAQRVGVRISPVSRVNDSYDSDPEKLFAYFLQQLDKRGLGFVEVREFDKINDFDQYWPKKGDEQCIDCLSLLGKYFTKGALMSNQGNTFETGQEKINKGLCDLISFGKFAISNPDLPLRFKNNWPLASFDPKTLYVPGPKGYTDYPTYQESQAAMQKGQ